MSLWKANYQGCQVLRILKSCFIFNMHPDLCWLEDKISHMQAFSDLFTLILPLTELSGMVKTCEGWVFWSHG